MKRGVIFAALILVMGNIGGANAQNAAQIVTPTTSAETTRTISDAVSQSADDALKSDQKKSTEMEEKSKAAEGGKKQGKK